MSPFTIALWIFGLSQLYWFLRGYRLAARHIPLRLPRYLLVAAVLVFYAYLFQAFPFFGRGSEPVHLTLKTALLEAPFRWWIGSSFVAFVVVLLIAILRAPVSAARWIASRLRSRSAAQPLESASRRQFLERAATVATAAPFVAGVYGLLYGRLNLETSAVPIRLAHLPKAFDGFRICQLSDIHIGPFMPAEEIRKYVAIANALKPDLIALTGDFVTFDPGTQQAVVDALAGLRAPFGIFGCLGNHDAWAQVQDSITRLFAQTGVHILRSAAVPIAAHGESFNLIGVDFESRRGFGPSAAVPNLLGDIENLIAPDRVNILLSHNPDTFDRAAELGIDLSLAGHTHGGQLALEFISPEIAPSRLVTPYVSGLFQKPGSQLYVNRGIGTIGIPIRLGAPPEITLYTLIRS